MRVSTQFPIAVHIMLMVAGFPNQKMTSEIVAESAGVNPVIIRNIFSKLNNAGLLDTKSGRGKTAIMRPADEITLWDIYTAVESEETDEVFKFHQNTSETCVVGSNIYSILSPHLDDAVNTMKNVFFKVTLQSLIEELYAKINKKNGQ